MTVVDFVEGWHVECVPQSACLGRGRHLLGCLSTELSGQVLGHACHIHVLLHDCLLVHGVIVIS